MSFVSVFDLFKVGIGPSSSHTVGPMRAALAFRIRLLEEGLEPRVARIRTSLFGSLAHTGRGHHTDRAVVWGLAGLKPATFDAQVATGVWNGARLRHELPLGPESLLPFQLEQDLIFDTEKPTTVHPNEMRMTAFDEAGLPLLDDTWFSVGGGFIAHESEIGRIGTTPPSELPYPFRSVLQLLELSRKADLPIWDLVRANERTVRTDEEIDAHLHEIWSVMSACIDRGLSAEGILPGGLQIRRRAQGLHRRLTSEERRMKGRAHTSSTDWVHVWAMAVNEENAAGGQVVTAPTNGAAGVVPAVFKYYLEFVDDRADAFPRTFEQYFLTATAIGGLFKMNASISGAEVGCQGEVGTAASMAAAGLCALLGGNSAQIEHAAEIAIEHNLGLTCDPVGGLVQVPCIERNGFGAAKAISAARLAMHEDGEHRVTLDHAIETVRLTGLDMSHKYKETSQGGLAVSVVEC